MPALGELDYCIPGPNPSWQTNSTETYEAFSNYVSDIKISPADWSKNGKKSKIETPDEPNKIGRRDGSAVYRTYQNIFSGSNLWNDYGDSPTENTPWGPVKVTETPFYEESSSLGSLSAEKTGDLTETLNDFITKTFAKLDIFNKNYPTLMTKIYGPIQNKYLEYEGTRISTVLKEENPQYLPMAKEGLALTKKMSIYNSEVIDADTDLKLTIGEAQSNIDKLNVIKSEVAKIVIAAQERREKDLQEILEKMIALDENDNIKTIDAAKKEYAKCLVEENISYLSSDDIMDSTQERCGDKIDNDFDGLIDGRDPDCPNFTDTTSQGWTGSGSVSGSGNSSGNGDMGLGNTINEAMYEVGY